MTMRQNKTRRFVGTAAALLVLVAGAACGQEPAEDIASLPYDTEFIYHSDSHCGEVEPVIAPEFFLPEAEAAITEEFDLGVLHCTWLQAIFSGTRSVKADVGMIDAPDWEEQAREWADSVTTDDFIPVEGLGDIALLGPTNADTDEHESYGLELYVFEGNMKFEASAESITDTGDVLFRGSTLASAEASLVAMAEVFLKSVGAADHTAAGPEPAAAGEAAAAPEICADSLLGSWTPADDSDAWGSDLESLRQCHFTDGEDQLWVSAESFAAPSSGGMSAGEFASWWASARDGIESTAFEAGDEARYRFEETDGRLAVHLLVRSGNLVIEARFIGPLDDGAAAEEAAAAAASAIGADLDALLEKQ